jgi:ribosomal protein S27E
VNDRSKFEAAVHGAVVEAKRKAEADPSPVERYRLEIGEIFVGFALPDKDWYGLDHDEELVRWLKWRGKGSLKGLRCPECLSERCYLTICGSPAVTCYSCGDVFSTPHEVLGKIERMEREAKEREERYEAERQRAEDEAEDEWVRQYHPHEELRERMNGDLKGLSDFKVFEALLRQALAPNGSPNRPEDYDAPSIELMEEVFPSVRVPEEDWRELTGFDAVIRYLKKNGKPRRKRCPRCGSLQCYLSLYSMQPFVCYRCFHMFPTFRQCEEQIFDLGKGDLI